MPKARIVVGVDGSAESARALRWATREADKRDAMVEAVFAYRPGALHGPAPDEPPPEPQQSGTRAFYDPKAEAAGRINDTIEKAGVGTSHVEIAVTPVADNDPANALAKASEGADMLVVGSRGRGGFKGLLLGSVSSKAVHLARSPVVVMPSSAEDEAKGSQTSRT